MLNPGKQEITGDRLLLLRQAAILRARRSFWEFCKLLHPEFYKDTPKHEYLYRLCDILEKLYRGTLINPKTGQVCRNLITCLPRRWGKSFTYTLFEAWCLGQNPLELLITISYNAELATDFSVAVRNKILEECDDPSKIIYSDIFPMTKMAKGSKSVLKWRLDGSPRNNYLGTGVDGTLTGKGATILVVDDLIRNAKEAYNDQALEDHYKFWTGSVLQVVENNGIKIVNFTRWRNEDLIGKILNGPTGDSWYLYSIEACINGEMQCPPSILSYESYKALEAEMDPLIFRANYHQETVDFQGRLYDLKTYDLLPKECDKTVCLVDVATSGNDYLCAIIARVCNGQAWITDVIHTQEDTEKSEIMLVDALIKNEVDECIIESNSAGGLFAKNISRRLQEKMIWNINIETFFQSSNKTTRILTASSIVNKSIFVPYDWNKWKSFYREIQGYQKMGKNKHDDAADTISLLAERLDGSIGAKFVELW
jgi:predicted phage terminase large subunit-like protein